MLLIVTKHTNLDNHTHIVFNPYWQYLSWEHHSHLVQKLTFYVTSMEFLTKKLKATIH